MLFESGIPHVPDKVCNQNFYLNRSNIFWSFLKRLTIYYFEFEIFSYNLVSTLFQIESLIFNIVAIIK